MEFFEVIKKRHCCRSFNPNKDVRDEDLEKIIKAGQMAPSAGGIYPIDFDVVKEKTIKEQITKAALGQDFIAKAPVVIIIWADVKKTAYKYGKRGENLYVIQDAAAAAENIFLAVTAFGLSACWVGAFDEEKIKEIFGLEKLQRPMVVMPIGYSYY